MQTLQQFITYFNEQSEAHYKGVCEASWMAQTTGDPQWAEKLSELGTQYSLVYASTEKYEEAQALMKLNEGTDLEKRNLELLVADLKGTQLPEEVIADISSRSSQLNVLFNTYMPTVNGKDFSANVIRDILSNSLDNELREAAWKASKEVGKVVEKDLLELVKKRNEAAQLLGYKNHYEMGFDLQELNMEDVFAIFEDLITQSDAAYRTLKCELDERLAKKFQVSIEDIRPWHYIDPFFQEAPPSDATNLDSYYKGKDIVQLTKDTFNAMGIDVDDLFEKSDLYPRAKKNPTAFCTDIDRSGDVRVLCNIEEDAYWMETNLHEFGHAAYFKYIDRSLPFRLREPSHTLSTESIAMLFGKMGKDPRWLKQFLQLSDETIADLSPELMKFQQAQMLISARWMMTFVFFEKELYENPDQDLNSLWWDIVQKVQLVTPPENRNEPDWAAKIHFTLAPVYYQNYLLGELMSAQLLRYIEKNISPAFFTKEAGTLLIEEFFKPGTRYNWNEKIKRVTGETLNPTYFVELNC
jgi:oligoendopeptidase F